MPPLDQPAGVGRLRDGPPILGYGEDALTLWALNCRLPDLLGHPIAAGDVVMYRPSFGRGGGAMFGEFDAIIGTRSGVYLIESKWEGSTDVKRDGTVVLRTAQSTRHEVFAWYLQEWQKATQQNGNLGVCWERFVTPERVSELRERWRKTFPEPGSKLARNLTFVLNKLAKFADCIHHEVWYFHFAPAPTRFQVPQGYRPRPIQATSLPDSMYIDVF